MDTTRRHFLSIMAAFSGTALLAAACEESYPGSTSTSDAAAATQQCGVRIASNHGHELAITRDDATAGAAAPMPTTLHIRGTSSHDHTITLAPADFGKLLAGESVSVTSSSDLAHTHVVTLMC